MDVFACHRQSSANFLYLSCQNSARVLPKLCHYLNPAVTFFDDTIIAHNSFSVIGKVLPNFYTTFDSENAIWLPRLLVAIFDNTMITCFVCLVTAKMLSKNFTTFVTLVRGLNQGAVLDTIIINTFISRVISIMFPISSQVFPKRMR